MLRAARHDLSITFSCYALCAKKDLKLEPEVLGTTDLFSEGSSAPNNSMRIIFLTSAVLSFAEISSALQIRSPSP
jgi:hypothetical protein